MDLPLDQIAKVLNGSNRVLLTGPANPNVDVVSTAAAWWLFLTGQKKLVDISFSGRISKFNFLPNKIKINDELKDTNKFQIVLDTNGTGVKQLSYDLKEGKLVINIIPENGTFDKNDVSTEKGDYKYDLIIIFGATSLESLGKNFDEHRHFFHNVKLVNIDRSILNENFGRLNIVESGATSLADISYHVLKKHIDKDMATCLLAGMISATNSFQSPQVRPDTLEMASQLIIKGADRENIVESLYRTKDIATLKNWGKVLSRLSKKENVISSYLNHDEVDNLPQDFEGMVRELILSTPDAQVAIIFYQLELHKTEAWVYTIDNINALDLGKNLKATGHRRFIKISIDKEIDRARDLIIKNIKDKLKVLNTG
ncbi:hypothetical protein HON36_00470 [Candidatus Parcubacteria bacterium]|nr:hypothetical protein [Candidatus Parcubacteria bacterium]